MTEPNENGRQYRHDTLTAYNLGKCRCEHCCGADDMTPAGHIQARLRESESIPGILAASFDAFEVIRLLARQSQHRVGGLFAAFMSTADAAVDGREAVIIAPSPPATDASTTVRSGPAASTGIRGAIEPVAALATLLHERLTRAATIADDPGDRAACEEAAEAATRISQLMAGGADDPALR